MFLLDNKPLGVDTPFVHEEIQYPANWLRLASAEDRAALGITEVPTQDRPDDRFYWVSENPDGSFTKTPKDLDTLKKTLVSQVKTTAGSLLAATDWKVIRASETATAISEDVLAAGAAIRQKSNDLEMVINAYTSVAALETIEFSWPDQES